MNSDRRFITFLIAPAAVVIAAVVVYPFLYNLVLSLSNMSLLHIRDWEIIGLRQYEKVLTEPRFYHILWKTLLWTVISSGSSDIEVGSSAPYMVTMDMPAGNW